MQHLRSSLLAFLATLCWHACVQEHVKFPGEKEEDSSNPGGNAEHAGGSCEHKQQQQKEQEPKLQQQLPRWQDGHAPASYVSQSVGTFATGGPGTHPSFSHEHHIL